MPRINIAENGDAEKKFNLRLTHVFPKTEAETRDLSIKAENFSLLYMQSQLPIYSTRGEEYIPRTPESPTPSGAGRLTHHSMNQERSRSWVFTTNNYGELDCLKLDRLFSTDDLVSYLVYGREIGDSGTPHLQGAIVFKSRKTFNKVRDLLPFGSHVEKMRGSPKQASDYCKKDAVYKEFVNLV